MKQHYESQDLHKAFNNLAFENQHEVIFISGDLGRLGLANHKQKHDYLTSLFDSVIKAYGENTTIMTSTFTHDLINTGRVYDKKTTPSMHGAIANFIINHPNSIRSAHPFTSFCAVGPKADYLCGEDLIHPYGMDSPYDKMLKEPLNNSPFLRQ